MPAATQLVAAGLFGVMVQCADRGAPFAAPERYATMMDENDDALAWVLARFNEPETNAVDARLVGGIAGDQQLAAAVKDDMTRPPEGRPWKIHIGSPRDPALATPDALAQLDARLALVGARAVPFEGEWPHGPASARPLWTVRVPESHARFVHTLVAGAYAVYSGPDD
jgi:hypothetical protein